MFRRKLIWYWLPVVVWMVFIFWGSTDALSTKRTSRFTRPFLLWLKPDISEEAIELAQLCVRKTGHAVEYAILAGLAWRALYQARDKGWRGWLPKIAWGAWSIAVGYAFTDEFHQSFVGSRQGSLQDVGFDSLGASFVMLPLWAWVRWWPRWSLGKPRH